MSDRGKRRRRKKRAGTRSTEARAVIASPRQLTTKLAAVLLIGIGIAGTYRLAPQAVDGMTMVFLLAMGIGPIAVGAMMLYRGSRSNLAASRVGTPRVAIDPHEARIGEQIAVVVELTPLRDVTVRSLRIELVGRDEFPVDWHDGEDRNRGRARELHRETRELPGRQLRASELRTFDASFRAPEVWASIGATASWRICVQVAYADCPDWEGDYPISVEAPPDV